LASNDTTTNRYAGVVLMNKLVRLALKTNQITYN